MAFINDTVLLNEVQYDVIETPDLGATFPSGLWDAAEVLAMLNLAQRRFVRDTLLVVGRTNFTVGAGTERTDIEALGGLEDVFQIIRVVYVDSAGVFHEIPEADLFSADHGLPSWAAGTATVPQAHSVTDGLTTELIFMPAPTASGVVWLHFIPRLVDLARTPDPLQVPPEFALGVKWRLLQLMLEKPGRSFDRQRADYCKQRAEEMATLSTEMVEGIV
jgi:hypothetical protein